MFGRVPSYNAHRSGCMLVGESSCILNGLSPQQAHKLSPLTFVPLAELCLTSNKALDRGLKYGISFPEHVRKYWKKSHPPFVPHLGPAISKSRWKGNRESFPAFLRLTIPTSKPHSPLAILTINTKRKILIYKRASKTYSPHANHCQTSYRSTRARTHLTLK